MRPFMFSRPTNLDEAIADAGLPDSLPIAGGTELINLMREGICTPARVFDMNSLSELASIDINAKGLLIGALTRLSDIAQHEAIVRDFTAITQAVLESASPQIRNMATLGGNLMQRNRCAYFRNGEIDVPCNKRKMGSGCAALIDGRPRDFAVFSRDERCVATNPSDVAVALAAFEANVRLRSSRGDRTLPVLDFLQAPEVGSLRDTALYSDELILTIEIPTRSVDRRSSYLKLRDRASYEFAFLSAAAVVTIENNRIIAARLAMGGLANRPWRLVAAETAMRGVPCDSPDLPEIVAADLASSPARPGTDTKLELAMRLAVRAIRVAVGHA